MPRRTYGHSTHADQLDGRRGAPWRTPAILAIVALGFVAAACVPPPGPPGPPGPGTGGSQHFSTLGVGAALPSDADCRSRVRAAPENRAVNARFNQTVGHAGASQAPYFNRITGNFTGTTDQIIQWTACKWGIDEDIVRAQIAKESWWHQDGTGDYTSDPNNCAPGHPIGADGRAGQCPESIGLGQVRTQYYRPYINDAVTSSAYNLDTTYATWRSCFEGAETWLNTVERGRDYAAGDVWGCVGTWFSGRWYTAAANGYISGVQDYLNQRIWTTSDFANG